MATSAADMGNTCLCGPDEHGPGERVDPAPMQEAVEATLQKHLENAVYDPIVHRESVRAIADELRATCSALAPPRYKVITHVVLWEKDGEASAAASRALWSAKEDAVALKVAESDTLCAAAAVWALYFE